jgi:phytoene desaturase
MFRETIRDAGLNKFLFEMANIRDQCSWVHMNQPEAGTLKAKDLIRSAVAKARHINPLKQISFDIDRTALVVGGGISGMVSALHLARQGFQVSVYEKNSSPGGRCGQISRDGHRFDLGATIYLMPEVYRKVFESLGTSPEKLLDSNPLSTLYTLYFPDGVRLAFSSDMDKMKEQLEKLEKGSFDKSQQLQKEGYKLFHLAMDKLIGRNFFRLLDFVTLKNALLLVRLKTYIRHITYIRRFFRHKHLQTAFTFQNIYVGQDPYHAPALFSMIPAAELTEGSLFPTGGMFSITLKLVAMAEELGVRFIYDEPATKIKTEGKQAIGIVLQNGSLIRASVIVANADLPYVYRELLPDKGRAKRLERLKYTCSAIVLHWGLDKTFDELGHHSVFLSGDYKSNLKKIFRYHSLSPDPSFYIHAPVRSDKTAAPPGHDTLSVIIPAGHLDDRYNYNWNELKNAARASVISRLKQMGLTDLEEHIKFEICYLPQTWKSIFNLSRGATFGSVGHQIWQMGYFRPQNKHRKYRNLYFAGGSTHPGNGIPLVLLSAKLTSERILKEYTQ